MIDSLIIKSEIYRKKENELKEKDDKIEYLSKSIEELKKVINLKNDEIKSLKSKLNIVEDKLNRFNEFLNLVKIVDEIKIFKNNFLNFSKITKNEIMFHDKDKIYINKKFLEDNFFKTYENMLFKDKLHLLKLLNLIEVSEENRFTKKVFVNGKYKRMIIFNRHILDFYNNLCS
ncbi:MULTISPECIES: hypothetical protein [Bacteria]|jgi:hypothetical protein|uniref:hypothetical protein n=1 Tax=Bacteria TaxID=2 RepID=UPI0012428496|nr:MULTISPECIES: hypothetical protein [Bacteria]MDU2708749.1 hypothetical protein [Klebsiella grimontii]EHK2350030.1 hypothetical protein [Clostridium perfringens]EHK2389743.1 hypothetical protein [Clostridium perfringens]EIF2088291.1 hypothetical protein [Clostridium perfringens]EIF6155561.1 hypothetical protein [Clostridium perfringens]